MDIQLKDRSEYWFLNESAPEDTASWENEYMTIDAIYDEMEQCFADTMGIVEYLDILKGRTIENLESLEDYSFASSQQNEQFKCSAAAWRHIIGSTPMPADQISAGDFPEPANILSLSKADLAFFREGKILKLDPARKLQVVDWNND